jgi:hypothetical protein
MVYPPDIYGSPVTQDTKIDQSILNELIKLQGNSEADIPLYEISPERHNAMIEDIRSMENIKEDDSESDGDNFDYADLPDLSELEEMIDWDDINDTDDLPARPDHKQADPPDLDVNDA